MRDPKENDLDRELQSHLDLEAEETNPDAARRALGNVTQIKEDVRAAWGWTWIERLAQDLRYALRTLRHSPGFAATAVLSLALGIGANTAIFSLMDALMLRWLPVRDPQELVMLQTPGPRGPNSSFSYAAARAFPELKDIFSIGAGFSGAQFDAGVPGSVARVQGAWVTGLFYQTLGLQPSAGRLLLPEDDQPGAPLVAVLSHGYWQRQFAGSPAAIGQTMLLNNVPVTIVGVSPPGFVGANVGSIANITLPVAAIDRVAPDQAALLRPTNFWLRVLARPAPGLTAAQARARLAAAWPRFLEPLLSPAMSTAARKDTLNIVVDVVPGGTGYTRLRDTFRKPLQVLMGIVALVLLIACANVANLLLARSAARQREIAVRLAIGAGRARIIRQLLTESTLLSLAGAALGIGLAWICGRFLVGILNGGTFDLTPNWNVLGFTTAVAFASAMLFGLAPAFQTTKAGPSPGLKEDARQGRSRSRLLSSLVSVQVALSLLLLIGAGLFVRTLKNLENIDPGFRREGVLLVDLEGRRTVVPGELLTAIRAIPGVSSASISTHTPLSGSTWTEIAVPKGQTLPQRDNAVFTAAASHFFETLRTPLIAGREFTDRDTANTPSVAVVNDVFAERHFPGRNPVGEHLSAVVRNKPRDLEIIGVAKSMNLRGLRQTPPATVYVSYFQLSSPDQNQKFDNFPSTIEVRAAGSLTQVTAAIEHELQRKLPNTPIEIRPLSAQVEATMVQERMMATLAGAFGVLALTLACIGLYGLLAYTVARRTKEMGIRMALGARRRRVIGMVLKNAATLVAIGIALGLPAAWLASGWVKTMLFGLTPADPSTIALAAVILAAAALLAAYLPARRASLVEPVTALRHE